MSEYEAKPGSVADRVIGWLETQPPGAEYTISALAEAAHHDAGKLQPNLLAAIEHGAIERRLPAGQSRPWMYRLAKHPKANGTGHRVLDELVQRTVELPQRVEPQPAARAVIREKPKPETVSVIRLGLFNDGSLHIERAGETLVLLPAEAGALRRFLATVHEVPV